MASFSIGAIESPYGTLVYVDGISAMYYNAQKRGDTKLMAILEHRAEVHDGGPCFCDKN